MNKKFFQSTLAVIAMMFGVNALAQTPTISTGIADIGLNNPILDQVPMEYPKVAGDGTVVMRDLFVYHQNVNGGVGVGDGPVASSITIIDEDGNETGTDGLQMGDRVILQLPQGVNFAGMPTAVAGAFTEELSVDRNGSPLSNAFTTVTNRGFVTGGDIALRLGSGGPNRPLDNADIRGSVILEDTDIDGGMDKATVIVATASEVTDSGPTATGTTDDPGFVSTRRNEAIRFQGSVTVSAAAASSLLSGAPTTPLEATLTVRSAGSSDGDTASVPTAVFRLSSEPNTIAEVQAGAIASPVNSQNRALPAFINDPGESDGLQSFGSTTTSHLLTVPAGYSTRGSGNSIFVELSEGLRLAAGTVISVTRLTDGSPNLTHQIDSQTGRVTLSFNRTATIRRQTQYLIAFSGQVMVEGLRGSGGSVTADYFGGLDGSAIFANLSLKGTSVRLSSDESPAELVIDAQQPVDLPEFMIISGFPGDAGAAGDTITIQVPQNFVLADSDRDMLNVNASCGTGDSASDLTSRFFNHPQDGQQLILNLVSDCSNETVITVDGLKASLTERASAGPQVLTLRSNQSNMDFTNGIAVVVAQGIEAGEVTLTNTADDIDTLGPSRNGSVSIRITESTYGSVRNNQTPSTFIRIEPSANVRMITAVTTDSASRKDFLLAPAAEASPPDGSWIINVRSESSSRLEEIDNRRITIFYTVRSDAAIGEQVTFTFSGTAGLSGTIEAANVMQNSVISVEGEIPDLTASADAQAAATIMIEAQYPGAIDSGYIRLIAPAGIIFSDVQPAPSTRSRGLSYDSLVSTNSFSDTLRLAVTPGTDTLPTLTYTPAIIVQESAAAGLAEFRIVDGLGRRTDEGATTTSGVTSGQIDLVYVGDIDELDAGADSITVAEGFSISQTVSGGAGEYEATSDSDEVALSEVSDGTLTITGVSVGSATITVSDELGNTDTIAVEVVAAGAAPDLSAVSTGGETSATISGGVTVDGGVTYSEDGVVAAGDDISILFTINVESDHVGEEGDIYVAVLDVETDTFFIIDGNSQVIPDDPDDPDDGVAPFDSRTLTASETVKIRGGAFNFNPSDLARLNVAIFAGYTVDGLVTIIFNEDGVPLRGFPLSGE